MRPETFEHQLTVGMLSYNSEKTLPRVLKALACQSRDGLRLRLHVIDHGSTDHSVKLIRDFLEKESIEGRIEQDAVNNLARSRRKIVESCETPWLAFVDADVILRPGWAGRAIEILKLDEKAAGVSGPSHLASREVSSRWLLALKSCARSALGTFGSPQMSLRKAMPTIEHLPCSAVLYRLSVLRQISFDERLARAGEDLELGLRLRKNGWRLLWHSSLRYRHLTAAASGPQWCLRMDKLGRGRSEVAWLHPDRWLTFRHLLPLAFLPALAMAILLAPMWPLFLLLPASYLALVLAESGRVRSSQSLLRVAGCFFATHFAYAYGQWRGLWRVCSERLT